MHFPDKFSKAFKACYRPFFLLHIFWALFSPIHAQTPISISYFAPYFSQPGAKIGSSFVLTDLDKADIERQLSIRPQVGFFSQIGSNQSYFLNAELSLLRKREGKKRFQEFGLGLGYLMDSRNLGPVVDLGSAAVSNGSRENSSFITPTLNYSLGINPERGPAYQFKLFFGKKFSFENKGELFFGFETGIILNHNK
ncbi:MAG: hypothetical protein AAFR87_03205 [Bacteroidota bacterium]